MSDHDTVSPEIDDELRTRLRAFAREVMERTDTAAALERMPRRSRPPTVRLVAIAACFILAAALAAAVVADRQSVDTAPVGPPPSTTSLARGVVRFAEPPPSSGLGVPPGGGLPVPAGQGLGGQTLAVTAEAAHGEVTGQARFTLRDIFSIDPEGYEVVVGLECAATDADDLLLGGTVTTSVGEGQSGAMPRVGAHMALIIREGEPDRATVWWTTRASSCGELLESVPEPRPDDRFVDVVDGDDIETGARE